jgi:hypothetical protein
MAWLVGIIAVGIFLALLFKFSKPILGCLGAVVGLCVILYLFLIYLPQEEKEKNQNLVLVTIKYDEKGCGTDYPIAVTIRNRSRKTLKRIEWRVEAYRHGYSSNLNDGYDSYTSDKILAPDERWSMCYRLPIKLNQWKQNASTLEYKISGKYVYFE